MAIRLYQTVGYHKIKSKPSGQTSLLSLNLTKLFKANQCQQKIGCNTQLLKSNIHHVSFIPLTCNYFYCLNCFKPCSHVFFSFFYLLYPIIRSPEHTLWVCQMGYRKEWIESETWSNNLQVEYDQDHVGKQRQLDTDSRLYRQFHVKERRTRKNSPSVTRREKRSYVNPIRYLHIDISNFK